MKLPVLCLAVLSSTLAVPNGYYHQEYNYKTSSSSFKNNELQHKTDDQGYYKKDGDLDGQTKPRVDSNSEHSEYVNPNLRNSQYGSQYTSGYAGDSDLTSLGVMRAANDYSGYDANGLAVDGLAQNDRVVGSRGYSSGYSGYGSSNYGSSSSSSAANLRVITSHLQQDLENDLREAIRANNLYAQSRVDLAHLESELRRNLTERLNNELIARYGQQMIRNGMSYSLDGGRLHSTANYNNQELDDLKNQVENTLLNQLKTQYHTSSSSSSQYYGQHNQQQGSYGYSTTPRPVYRPIYPTLPTTARYPIDYNANSNYNTHSNYQTVNSNYQTVNANARYTPIPHPESITSIASKVQSEMDRQLNQLLDETKTKYFSSSSAYGLTNTEVLLERLRNELRSNLTYMLDENVRRNYGTQQQKDGYMYSLGPSGQFSSEYNYALRDLENLKAQVERNLINKLNNDIEGYKTSWSTHQSYSSQSSYGNSYDYSSTPRYDYYSNPNYGVYTTPRSSIYSLYTTPSTHGASYVKNGGYNYAEGSQNSGYEVQSSGNMAQLQRNLQEQLSRQLQAAINQEQSSTYSTSGSGYSPSNYQSSLQELSNELNRNLTRNLQEYSASGSYAAYGNFDSAQMERLKTQLQESLMSQLRQGLQRSFQSHGTYSSSGNSNYRQVRGFQNQQQYRFEQESKAGEDCDGHQNYRAKRSYSYSGPQSHYSGYGSEAEIENRKEIGQQVELGQVQELESPDLVQEVQNPLEFGQQEEDDYGELVSSNKIQLGQQIDDFTTNEQTENVGYGRLSVHNQNQRPMEVGQQVEDEYTGSGKLMLSNQEPIEQQTYNSDLSQQVVDTGYRTPQSQSQMPLEVGQQVEDEFTGNGKLMLSNQEPIEQQTYNSDLSQQVVDTGYRTPQSQSQMPLEVGQQVEDEFTGNGKLMLSNQEPIEQQTYNSDLSQQVVDTGYRTPQSQSQMPLEVGQQVEDEFTGNGKLMLSNQEPIEQQTYNSDLSQQVVDSGYRRLQSQSEDQSLLENGQRLSNQEQLGQQIDDQLSQLSENGPTGDGRLQFSNQEPLGQQIDDTELTQHPMETGQQVVETQQTEDISKHPLELGQKVDEYDTGYGKLQILDQKPLEQQEESRYTGLQAQHQTPLELGEQIEKGTSHSTQQISNQNSLEQMIDSDGLNQQVEEVVNPVAFGQQINNEESNTEIPGQKIEQSIQHVEGENQRPLELGQQTNDQQLNQFEDSHTPSEVSQHGFNPDSQIHQVDEQTTGHYGSPQMEDNLVEPAPHEPSTQNQIIQSHDDFSKWCDKYVDTSLMDAPWFLGRELKENITKVVFQNGGNKADSSNVLKKVLEGIPKKMLTQCFQIENIELKYQRTVLAGLEEYFQTLIRKDVDDAIKGNSERNDPISGVQPPVDSEPVNNQQVVQSQENGSSANHDEITLTQGQPISSTEVSIDSNNWCSQYVDLSVMDTAWSISKKLKNNIVEKVCEDSNPETTYNKILAEIPTNMLRKCFQIDTMKPNEQELVLAGIEDYFQSLIRREIGSAIKSHNNQLTVEDLNQQVDNTANHPLIEPSTRPNNQVSNQNQLAPQTIAEAERFGDALIVALRKKNQSRLPVSQESPGDSRYATPQSNPNGSPNPQVGNLEPNPMDRQYGYNRELYAPYGQRPSYDFENFDGNHQYFHSQSHHSQRYPSFTSYNNHHQRLDNPNPNVPGTYGSYSQIPQRHVVQQNMESGSPHFQSYGLYHRQHQRHRHYGHHGESSSNIEQLNGGNLDNMTPIKVHHKPVYSGIKGRRIVHPITQEPLQKPIQVPVQIPVQEPVQEPVISPVSVAQSAQSSSDDFKTTPEKMVLSEQVASQSPEELSWWQKFGNKMKQGAQSLKQKIVG